MIITNKYNTVYDFRFTGSADNIRKQVADAEKIVCSNVTRLIEFRFANYYQGVQTARNFQIQILVQIIVIHWESKLYFSMEK